LVFFFLQTKW